MFFALFAVVLSIARADTTSVLEVPLPPAEPPSLFYPGICDDERGIEAALDQAISFIIDKDHMLENAGEDRAWKIQAPLNALTSKCESSVFTPIDRFLRRNYFGATTKREFKTAKNQFRIGLDVPDQTLIDQALAMKGTRLEGLVDLPEFLLNLPEDWAEQVARCLPSEFRDPGCPALPQGSRFLRFYSFSSVERPAVVSYLPGPYFDRWTIMRKGLSTDIQVFSLQKTDAAGEALEKALPFWTYRDENRVLQGGKDCIHCHSGGLNQIRPLPGSLTFGDHATLEQLNAKIRAMKIDTSPWIDRTQRGPAIGKQSCTSCHSEGGYKHSLIYGFQHRLREVISKAWTMPPRPRGHIFHELMAAYDKTDLLSAEDRARVLALYVEPKIAGEASSIPAVETASTLQARLEHLEFLRQKNLITEEEKVRLIEGVHTLAREASQYTDELVTEGKIEMRRWLQPRR